MKILSAETNLGSVTNVSNASVVRLFNSGDSNVLVTRKDYSGTTVGSFMVPAGDAVYAEKYYTDTLEASADVKASKTAYSSMMSFVGQTDSLPTYTLSVSATSVDEGGNFTTTVSTTNVDDGTQFNYVLSGTNVTSADFSSGSLNGTITISNNTASFSHTVANDTLTEGTETVTIKLFTDSGRNTQVGNTVTVTLNDTSLSPTYTATLSHTARDEGDSFTTTMTTTNVANSTELWWELSGTGIAAGDFSSGALTGSGTISSNTFNFSHTINEDNTTEGDETLSIKFYSDSGRTTQVGSTLTCTINDTSVTVSAPCGGSVAFDGSADTLNLPSSTDWSFGTGDFTIEAFCYRTGGFFLWDHLTAAGNFTIFSYANSDIRVYNNQFLVSGVNPGNDAWFHLAVVRQSGTLMFFINGTKASTTHNWTYNIGGNGTAGVNIGKSYWDEMLTGSVSNMRVTKGQAIYTSNFTPTTSALTTSSQGANPSNVVFLGLQSDNDVTAVTKMPTGSITVLGDPQAQSTGPFNNCGTTTTYTATVSHTARDEGDSFTTTMTTTNVADGTQLWWELSGTGIAAGDFSSGALTGSGTISSNTFNFSHTIANDNTTEGAETLNIKFYSDSGRSTQVGSTVTCTINDTSLTPPYYSNEFSAGDGMQVSGSTSHMGPFELDGNFTIECFFRVTTTDFPSTFRNLFNRWSNSDYQFQTHIQLASQANRFRFRTWVGFNDNTTTDDNSIVLNTWHHYALVRNNNNVRMYIDGVDKTSGGWSVTTNFNNNSNEEFRIGFRGDTASYDWIGNISDVRYTVGQAIYTSNFTKPSAPLTTTSQGANASYVSFLGMQSSTVTATTKLPGGTTYETGEGQSAPDISTDNPF